MAEAKDQEPAQPAQVQEEPKKRLRALDQASPVLSPQELSQSGVRKMMQDELERLRDENLELGKFRNMYYDSVKQCAIYEQRVKVGAAGDILALVCSSLGGALIGLSTKLAPDDAFYTKLLIAIGFLLLLAAAAAKWKMR